MREEHLAVAETVARDLAERRVDHAAFAPIATYARAHPDPDALFALLDDLAGGAGGTLEASGHLPGRYQALREGCGPLRAVPAHDLAAIVGWTERLLRYHEAMQPPAARPAPARPALAPRAPAAAAGLSGTAAMPPRPTPP